MTFVKPRNDIVLVKFVKKKQAKDSTANECHMNELQSRNIMLTYNIILLAFSPTAPNPKNKYCNPTRIIQDSLQTKQEILIMVIKGSDLQG